MFFKRKLTAALSSLLLLASLSLTGALAASGGEIRGTVADAKRGAVAGATVTVADLEGRQVATAVTDTQGNYEIRNVPAGTYTVTIAAPNFGDWRGPVTVTEGKAVRADARLEAAVAENVIRERVDVSPKGLTPNSDPIYVRLRGQAKDAQEFAAGTAVSVNNFVLKRDAAVFTLASGEIYFLPAVEGRTVGAVFIGDGELSLEPPVDYERKALAIFTGQPKLVERFTHLVLRFTDKTFEEIKSSPNVSPSASAAQAGRARDLYREAQTLLRRRFRANMELRTLADIYSPERPGYFVAFINGRRYEKLVYQIDPFGVGSLTPEEVALLSYGDTDGGYWTSFHLQDEYAKGTANSDQDNRLYDITHHDIDAAIKGTQIAATDRVTLKPLRAGARVLPFELFRTLRVSRVQDEAGRDLEFIQEGKDEDADFAVILPASPEVGKPLTLSIHYQGGDALQDSGGGNFILGPRASWYPTNAFSQFGVDRATFEMTFRYPKGNTFIGVGSLAAPEAREGDVSVTRWSSGKTELAVAGFNYGRFKKKEITDAETGYQIEFFANEQVPDQLRAVQHAIEQAESAGFETGTTLGAVSTMAMAGPVLADAQNAMRIYNAYFGKLPYKRLAMSQQPAAGFGQAWPTLVFMPYTAYMDTTQRVQLFGVSGGTSNFWRYVGPHEVAHQWWGHIIGWKSYRDQWMSEGFAEFSTSLYVQYVRRDPAKFVEFWEEQRRRIIEGGPNTGGIKPYTVGPVTQGFRLSNAKTRAAYQYLVYPKGAYVMHMLRMMMHDKNDARFQAMMKEFVQTHYNRDVSTEDFKRAVEKHVTPAMDLGGNGKMDWFFDQWVYGTDVPSYRFEYSITGNKLTGKVTQSGVSDNFRMLVPVYLDFGKGWVRLGQATITGNSTLDLGEIPLPQAPKRAAVAALNDVLAVQIENVKR